jgi:hypothetical protein
MSAVSASVAARDQDPLGAAKLVYGHRMTFQGREAERLNWPVHQSQTPAAGPRGAEERACSVGAEGEAALLAGVDQLAPGFKASSIDG